MKRNTHTIDAEEKVLGRLATEIAMLLRGKQKIDFAPNREMGDFVVVKNVAKIKLTGKKKEQKIYYHHSGYLGGLKAVPFEKLFKRDAGEVLRKAVYGMLPKNKLRSRQIKRLKFK
ncbi:50S ribosomal protein L13 [Patescibacteria group bacterium]|nr:50S ribosomal protein L13 [Patescibacteria group bacterium]